MTTIVSGTELAAGISSHFPEAVTRADTYAAWVAPETVVAVCGYLCSSPPHRYEMLSSLTVVDYVAYFDVVYHLTSMQRNACAVLKTRALGRETPTVPSVTPVWQAATLQEREAYDLMGVHFSGHPHLKRILLWEGFAGHPLRRDYLEPPLPYVWPHGG